MFVYNPLLLSNTYVTNKRIAKYLQKNGIPLLSSDGEFFYFSKTKKLEEQLLKLPFYLRWFA